MSASRHSSRTRSGIEDSVSGDVYRDLSTDCSIRAGSAVGLVPENAGVSIIDSGRARFNWQDRKRADLKHQAESCQRCSMTDVCEGVWAGPGLRLPLHTPGLTSRTRSSTFTARWFLSATRTRS